MNSTPCIHDESKSEITVIGNGVELNLLSCEMCTETIEKFSTLKVVRK